MLSNSRGRKQSSTELELLIHLPFLDQILLLQGSLQVEVRPRDPAHVRQALRGGRFVLDQGEV